MSEIKLSPIVGFDASGNETVTFGVDHTLSDIARWIFGNRADAEELHRIVGDMLNGVDGQVMQ